MAWPRGRQLNNKKPWQNLDNQNMSNKLALLKNEIGKPNPIRGAKARNAAINFEQFFRGKEFTSQEFAEWLKNEPTLAGYSPTKARHSLAMAGTRDDVPQPFQIVRTSKQGWIVQPMEKLIFSDQIPEASRRFFKKCRTRINYALQAIDWDGQDHSHRVAAMLWFRTYRGAESNALATFSTLQEMVSMLEDGGLFNIPESAKAVETNE